MKHYINTELTPSLADGYFYRALFFIVFDKDKEALQDFNRSIKLNPRNEYVYLERGKMLESVGNKKAALKDYNKALELNPNFAEAYATRGYYFEHTHKEEEALQDYNKALELNPNDLETRTIRADLLYDNQRYTESFLDYYKVLDQKPNDAYIYYSLALVLFPMGCYEAGKKFLANAAKLDPRYEEDLNDPYWEEKYGD